MTRFSIHTTKGNGDHVSRVLHLPCSPEALADWLTSDPIDDIIINLWDEYGSIYVDTFDDDRGCHFEVETLSIKSLDKLFDMWCTMILNAKLN